MITKVSRIRHSLRISVQNSMEIHSIAVQIFQSEPKNWTDRQTNNPKSSPTWDYLTKGSLYVPACGTHPWKRDVTLCWPRCSNMNWSVLGPWTRDVATHYATLLSTCWTVHKAVIWFWSISFYDQCQARAGLRKKRQRLCNKELQHTFISGIGKPGGFVLAIYTVVP